MVGRCEQWSLGGFHPGGARRKARVVGGRGSGWEWRGETGGQDSTVGSRELHAEE